LFTSRKAVIAAATFILFGVLVGSAVATLPSGQTVTLLARAHKAGALHAEAGGVTVKRVGGTADFATLSVSYDAGGSSGWHHHPGVGLVSVASGAVTVYRADCSHRTYTAGQAFVERGSAPNLVRNNGTTTALVYATFVIPTDTPATGLRIDDAQPAGCSVH
jgi:quercetin dioxygenase-like cupin family protein